MYKYICRNLDPTVFDCEVQICTYKDMERIQMDQGYDKSEWGQWDVQTTADKEAAKYHFDFSNMISETESVTTEIYDITSNMVIDNDLDLDSMNEPSVNENPALPPLPDIETVRAELNILGGNQSPPADFVMPENYFPASPIYSPCLSY